jgi:hypothetical protein
MKATRNLLSLAMFAWALNVLAESPLTVSISAERDTYAVGEPVILRVTIENTSARKWILPLDTGVARLWISREGGQFVAFDGDDTGLIPYPTRVPRLDAGDRLVFSRRMLLTRANPLQSPHPERWLAFPSAGTYLVKATCDGAVSETFQLRVRDPEGDDRKAWASIVETDLEIYAELVQAPELTVADEGLVTRAKERLQAQGRWHGEAQALVESQLALRPRVERIAQVVSEHPDSVYSQYLALALAKHYRQRRYKLPGSRRFDDPQVVELRQQEIHYFKLASEMKQGPASLREEAMRHLAAELNHPFDGTIPEAVEVARRALREFPDGTHRDWFERFIEKHTRPKWVDPMDIVGKELEAMGYDPEMADVSEAKIAEMTEYVHREPHRLRQEGKLTYEQMRAEQARRLKEWTLKNMQPSRPSR